MWSSRIRFQKDTSHTLETPYPKKCQDNCTETEREILGCGYDDRFIGKSQSVYSRNKKFKRIKDAKPWERTCPQYYANSIFFNSVLDLLDDYKNNRIGNVLDLPNPLLHYLRVANAEMKRWINYWESENINQSRKK